MGIHRCVKLVNKEKLKDDIYKFSVESEEICKLANPGQFLEIKVLKGIEPLLRRPISIYNVDRDKNWIEFIFQVKGKGTKILSEVEVGQEIDVVGPIGNGIFEIKKYNNAAIIGGGIGVFPLYELAKQLKIAESDNINTYLGFRSKEFVTNEDEFSKVSSKLIITTDDGSYKEKGFAINKLKEDIEKQALEGNQTDIIFACGPLPMLKAVQQLAIEKNIPCQLSLEERMACGLGVCLGCAVKLAGSDELKYKHVCKDGPVFWANEVEI
ncbi:MAG: dihydroorotate dehydrogenase electron transfer subunit [Clostridia bacterium]|nr:dihydroorotate dehydrogenase electron transfer subunit [Clostridia bacterium]